MNKSTIFALLLALLAMSATATEYIGTMTIDDGNGQVSQDNVVVNMVQNDDGTYTATMTQLRFNIAGQEMGLPPMTYSNLTGTPDDEGYINVHGEKTLRVGDLIGVESMIPDFAQAFAQTILDKTFPLTFDARFNDYELTAQAHFDINVTINIPFLGPITITDVSVNGNYYGTAPQSEYTPGDVNGDGVIDIDDVNLIINRILGLNPGVEFKGSGDINGDSAIDIDDVNLIINRILNP